MPRRWDLRLVVGSVGLSAMGDWLALVPLALHLERTTGSGIAVAGLFIALWGPSVLLAVPVGWLVDRLEVTRLLTVVSLAQAAVAVALAFTGSTIPLLALVALLGCGHALSQPAEFALVPAVAGEKRLPAANGQVETARYVGFTVGPLVGGLLAAGGGTNVALLVNAASFLVVASAARVLGVRRDAHAGARGAHAGAQRDAEPVRAREGIGFLLRDRVLALLMGVVFVSLLTMTASATAEVFFATQVLEVGEAGYGALLAAWTAGMALGALAVARRVPPGGLLVAVLAAIAVQGAGLAAPTLWLVFALALVFYGVGGLAHGTKNVLIRTLIHQRVPDRLHGRAFAAYNALRNAAELIALVGGGLLVAAVGARWTLLLAGTVPLVAAAGGLVAYRRVALPSAGPTTAPSMRAAYRTTRLTRRPGTTTSLSTSRPST